MGGELTNIPFDQWIEHVFQHPVAKPAWYWDLDADHWQDTPAVTVDFLTRTFERADEVLKPFTDEQVNQGLWFLASNSCSDYMFALLDPAVPWPSRQRCIQSMYALYERCFAQRCSPHLSHLDEPGANPVNAVCYMWWDIIPIYGKPNEPDRAGLDREILELLKRTLHLESDACRESALHGLGHWQLYYPNAVRDIIDDFIHSHGLTMRPELHCYAVRARNGAVQ